MRRQAGIVVGLFNKVLGPGTLVKEPHQRIQRPVHVGHKDSVDVLGGIEQLILLWLLGLLGFRRLLVAQPQEPAGFAPPLRLVGELALAVGIGQAESASKVAVCN